MRSKLLSILVLSILVASIIGGCAPASPTPSTLSTLTILSITEGNVFVMKAGSNNWVGAEVGMSLEAGDAIKTDDFSSAEITFFDGSTIELEAGTEIEVVSLDISSDTGSTTITLSQTIGTTISRVTKLLDPASSYEVETPTGVAAVRGSSMLVEVFADGSISVTNIEGEIWFIYDGGELQVPQGGVCILRFGELPRLILWESLGDIGGGEFNDIVTDLAIDKSDSSDSVDPGTDLTYTVQITNNGPSDSTGAAVLDILPSGVSFVSATDGGTYDSDSHTVSWTIGTLAKDASTSVNVTVTVNESTAPGIITNVAFVDANESDYHSTNDAATEDTTINSVNDAPTNISLDNSNIAENQPSNTLVGNFSTTDLNIGNTFTYTLVSGTGDIDNNSFNMLGSSLRTSASFDYETKNSYSIRVRSTDQGSLWVEKQFTITVTNANDPPVALDDSAITSGNTSVTIDVLNNDFDIDGDILTVNSVTQGTNGSVTNNGSNVTYTPALGFNGTDSFTYTISDGNGGTDTATVNVTVTATLASINVQIDTGAHASIYIWDNNTGGWATDEDTGNPVDGTNHVTPATIKVAGGHYYCVWVWAADVTYYVKNYPNDWTIVIISTPEGDREAAYGYAAAGSLYPVHFTVK